MRIEIFEPQAIWEKGHQPEQKDIIYPRKGEADSADRMFIILDGSSTHGAKGEDIVRKITGYFNRYRSGNGELTDEEIHNALAAALPTAGDGNQSAVKASLSMLCLHRGGITIVHVGHGGVYHVRPSESRLLFESRNEDDGDIDNPAIIHVTDLQPGDFFCMLTPGLRKKMNGEAVCDFFSEEGSDDKKRNRLRSTTADYDDNHSAYFFRIRNIVAEAGDEMLEENEQSSPDNALSGRPAPVRKPKPKLFKTTAAPAKPVEPANEKPQTKKEEPKVVRPVDDEEKPKKTEPATPQRPKPTYRKQPQPISRYDDERKSANLKIILLVAVIVVLAVVAGALWYFNSSSPATVPTDSVTVDTQEKVDTTSTAPKASDDAVIADSDIIPETPEKVTPKPTRHEASTTSKSSVDESETEEPTETEPTETEPKTEPTTEKPAATEAPKAETAPTE